MKLKLLLLGVLLISGCSTKFGYNNIDWLIHWYVDDYVDLDQQQRKQFDAQMEKFLAWHRDTELPLYRSQLVEIQQKVTVGDLNQQQWYGHLDQIRQHYSRSRDELAVLMAPLATTLTDEQVDELFAELKDQDEEDREDELAETPEQDRQERFERMVERMESWFGQFNGQQIALLEKYVDNYESSFFQRMDFRARIQQAMAVLLEQRNSRADFESQLVALIQNPEKYQGAELIESRAQRSRQYAALLAEINKTLSVGQREHLVEEIQDLVDDIDDLMLPSFRERSAT